MIRKKVNRRTNILWKLRPYISQELVKDLYTCYTVVMYMMVQATQNLALHAVAQAGKCSSATEIHHSLNVDWLNNQGVYHICVEVFKLGNQRVAISLSLKLEAIVPTRVLRSYDKIKLPKPVYKLKHTEMDFMYRSITY